jgi:hypothetical protein
MARALDCEVLRSAELVRYQGRSGNEMRVCCEAARGRGGGGKKDPEAVISDALDFGQV